MKSVKGLDSGFGVQPFVFFNTLRLDSQRAAVILPNSGITISQPRIANAKRFGAGCIGEEKSYFWSKKASIATRGTFSIHS